MRQAKEVGPERRLQVRNHIVTAGKAACPGSRGWVWNHAS
ncbi:hypothetical protein BIWAKO_05043 [Bosea sp. BIWAKO-01]|nr:hypothetical protein BIWAKO_05043 [Bosea sp. BIWAKO-01]